MCAEGQRHRETQPCDEAEFLGEAMSQGGGGCAQRWASRSYHLADAAQLLSAQAPEQRSQESPCLASPGSLFSFRFARDFAPGMHLVTSGCMSQCAFMKMCIYTLICVCVQMWAGWCVCVECGHMEVHVCAYQLLQTSTNLCVCMCACVLSLPAPRLFSLPG